MSTITVLFLSPFIAAAFFIVLAAISLNKNKPTTHADIQHQQTIDAINAGTIANIIK